VIYALLSLESALYALFCMIKMSLESELKVVENTINHARNAFWSMKNVSSF